MIRALLTGVLTLFVIGHPEACRSPAALPVATVLAPRPAGRMLLANRDPVPFRGADDVRREAAPQKMENLPGGGVGLVILDVAVVVALAVLAIYVS
jgi:hypothetical protein